jgi:signal transduction histidine kinase
MEKLKGAVMQGANELAARIESGKPWVLLVDDDVNILETAKDILEEANYAVQTASNGNSALKLIGEHNFNVVVVDFQLPDITGLELARKVREQNEHTLVILMTGHASLEMAVKAIQEAVYDYLIKPVDPAQLQRTLEKALDKQRLSLENKQLLHDLRTTNETIAKLDSLKSKMLTVMSHDLRTPLSSIRGYSELLKSGVKGKLTEAQKKILEVAIQESDHLNGLIGDLLDLASIEAGRLILDTKQAKFDEIIQKVTQRVRLPSEMKEIPVDVTLATGATVNVDLPRIIQVLSNLIRSSIKQAPRGGRVFVHAQDKGGMVEMIISHAGQGFNSEQIKSLQVSNHAAADSSGSQQDGFRIGFAIAREIVLAHGGQVEVESPGMDQGTTFRVRLPIVK